MRQIRDATHDHHLGIDPTRLVLHAQSLCSLSQAWKGVNSQSAHTIQGLRGQAGAGWVVDSKQNGERILSAITYGLLGRLKVGLEAKLWKKREHWTWHQGSPGAGCVWLQTEASDYSLLILGMTVGKEGQDKGRGLKAVCGWQPLRNKTLWLSRVSS